MFFFKWSVKKCFLADSPILHRLNSDNIKNGVFAIRFFLSHLHKVRQVDSSPPTSWILFGPVFGPCGIILILLPSSILVTIGLHFIFLNLFVNEISSINFLMLHENRSLTLALVKWAKQFWPMWSNPLWHWQRPSSSNILFPEHFDGSKENFSQRSKLKFW